MSDYKHPRTLEEIAEANKKWNAEQFETEVRRFELEGDKPPENPATINMLREEITRLQSEVERLRGRCAELESVLGSAWASHCLEAVDWVDQAKEVLSRSDSASWLLRKQAEAVEAATTKCQIKSATDDSKCYSAALQDYAQRLRQQAAESDHD